MRYLIVLLALITSTAHADDGWNAAMESAHRMGRDSDDVTQSQIRALQSLMPNHMQRREQPDGYNQQARPQTCVTIQMGFDGYGNPRYGVRCQ
jgi:hypothetical protein